MTSNRTFPAAYHRCFFFVVALIIIAACTKHVGPVLSFVFGIAWGIACSKAFHILFDSGSPRDWRES